MLSVPSNVRFLPILLAAMLLPSACGPTSAPVTVDSSGEYALGTCPWDPMLGTQGCTQGDWWVEFSVKDSTEADAILSPPPVALPDTSHLLPLLGGKY